MNKDEFTDALSFVEEWFPSKYFFKVDTRINLGKVLKELGDNNVIKVAISNYIERLKRVSSIQVPDEALASGVVFFYSCLLYITNFEDWQNHIDDVASFVMLYMLVDHYLDECLDSPEAKSTLVYQMYMLVFQPEMVVKVDSPFLKSITQIYRELIERRPQVRAPMIDLFMIEIKAWKAQKDPNSDLDTLLQLSKDKGGSTVVVLQRLMKNYDDRITQSSMLIGGVCQLLDDCLDIHLDKKNKITTVATRFPKLDHLWLEMVNMLKEIQSFGNLTWFLTTMVAILPCTMYLNFSDKFMSRYPYSKLEGSYRFDHEMRTIFKNVIEKM